MTASKRSALGLIRTSVGGQTVWALVGEASLRNTRSTRITTRELEALPIDRREADQHVANVMAALENHGSHRAATPGGASWLYVQHVPVRRLIAQLVRKLLALSAWEPFAESPGPMTLAPYEGLLSLRETSSREYRRYTVTWSGVAYVLGAPAPHNPVRAARLRKAAAPRLDASPGPTPSASGLPTAEVVALSWSSRHAATLMPVLEELDRHGHPSLLLDLATDPAERCPAPGAGLIRLCPVAPEVLAVSGTVSGLRLDTEEPTGTDGGVMVGRHLVRLDRLERLAAALIETTAGCTQLSWRAVIRTETWLDEVLTVVRPHTVLLSNDTSPLGALAVHTAERHGVNTVHVQHGAWTPEAVAWPALHSRHLVVMGERDVASAKAWVRHPEAEIHVLGQPRFDVLAGLDREAQRRNLRTLLATSSGQGPDRIAVWACQPFAPDRLRAQADIICDGLQAAQERWGLVIAPHPAQDSHAFEYVLQREGRLPVAVADPKVGARGCLAGADAVVSVYSTCGIEAVLLDVPVLELDLPGERTLGLADHSLAHRCVSSSDIASALATPSEPYLRGVREARDAVCLWQGNSARDIAQLIIDRARPDHAHTDLAHHDASVAGSSGVPRHEGASVR
ncbi:glycosyltransferase family protein [Streptomyces paludis]|uniref:UDP-N-acetylglucosamine 2-epimerase domain-containing protein n=1 Tax=Streptomyces paludis TaxID=2282738 RepID=A0A345HRQ5_9ACTN|nr:hypothetical protein [Streptomyces paludis]AXG79379.1 hypothetical protein DVK44_18910 [Streptomyces paludis]